MVEEECKLFNEIVDIELQQSEYLFDNVPIIPMLGLHLYKCMFSNNYQLVNDLLSDPAKQLVTLMWIYWNNQKNGN